MILFNLNFLSNKITVSEGVGEAGGREAQDRGDICILTANSHGCTAETSTTLDNNYPPVKKKF